MYVTIESITRQDGSYSVNTFKKETRDEAESSYHSILSAAAKSAHAIHAATLLNAEGYALKNECYKHNAPEPSPVPDIPNDEPEEGE